MGLTHHDGISVYGSGMYYGRKGLETPMFGTGIRADAGTTGFSGAINSVSTKLTTIVGAVATLKLAQAGMASGLPVNVAVDWSGGALDFQSYYNNTSASTSSAAMSSVVSWIAFGI